MSAGKGGRDPRPLAGKRVVNTRAEHQAQELVERLEDLGAQVLAYPTIRIQPLTETGLLDRAVKQAAQGDFHWLVLTSTNTVRVLAERLEALGLGADALSTQQHPELQVAAVGTATGALAEERLQVQVRCLPKKFMAEGLARALAVQPGQRIFLPQSAIARPVLAQALTAAGAQVTAVPAYRTELGRGGVELPRLLRERQVDVVTFTSASTVRNFVTRLEREGGDLGLMASVRVACIGPVTAQAARELDLPVDIQPSQYTVAALVAAIAAHFRKERA